MLLELSNNTMNESLLQFSHLHLKDMMLNLEEDDASDITLCKICEEVKKFSEKMIVKQTDALSIQFDYDSSQLTSEQK